MNKNDEQVLRLKKQVNEKKAALKKSEKFTPVTNCSIEFQGARFNVHALPKADLIGLLVDLNAVRLSAEDLGLIDSFMISGFKVNDWIIDLKARLAHIDRKEEEAKLKILENKLQALLSNDKKIELELQEIEELMK